MRTRIAVIAASATIAAAAVATTASSATTPVLKGTVGPGFTISLKDSKGKTVKTLKAGKYKFVISDKANIHNFTLQRGTGGGRALTTVPFVGTKSVLITLTKGRWKYYCTPHESVIFGFFTVT